MKYLTAKEAAEKAGEEAQSALDDMGFTLELELIEFDKAIDGIQDYVFLFNQSVSAHYWNDNRGDTRYGSD